MYKLRLARLLLLLGGVAVILILRLLDLQVLGVANDLSGNLESSRYRREEIPPLRGEIQARDGQTLARDQLRLDIAVPFATLSGENAAWAERISALTGTPREELLTRAQAICERVMRLRQAVAARNPRLYSVSDPGSRRYKPLREEIMEHPIVTGVSDKIAALVSVQSNNYGGAVVVETIERAYPAGRTACHALGHVGELRREDIPDDDPLAWRRYHPGDLIGRDGLESEYDALLRGTWGLQLRRDAAPRGAEAVIDFPAQKGLTVRATIHIAAQQAAEAALGDRAGAAVLLDIHTGEVLALASAPGYDNNRFRELFNQLRDDRENRPLMNHAIQDPIRLGSVMKVPVALAALDAGAITGETRFECAGSLLYGGRRFGCTARDGHGSLNVAEALERSCNIFFYQSGRLAGANAIADAARALGLGKTAGIDLPHESAGRIPNPEWKTRAGLGPWTGGETLNLSIGEGNVQVTPLQVAVMMAAIANGGKVPRPRLLLGLYDENGEAVPLPPWEPVANTVHFRPEHLSLAREGMRLVIFGAGGTARGERGLQTVRAAGKTGSAEIIPNQLYNAWIAGYAPYDAPQVAYAVALPNSKYHGGDPWGGAAPVAARMLETYFTPETK